MNRKQSATSDGQLVGRVLKQDPDALGEIYDRYADDIYTFCRSRLRSEADASDAMQETFVKAAERLSQLREPEKLRSWLFAIARNQIVVTGKTAAKAIGGDAMGEIIDLRSDVDGDLLRAEASAQLWDAAAGLSDRDQEVLELHVRHGLSGQALADAMGVSESHANVLMTRMRDRIATSLGGLLVARSGRADCDDLDMLLAGWDGKFTIDLRGRVTRHIRSCDVCERSQRTVLAAGAFMLPMIKAPAGLRIGTIDAMSEATKVMGSPATISAEAAATLEGSTNSGTAWQWRDDGFPYADDEPAALGAVGAGTSWLLAAAIFIFIALLGAGTWLIFGGEAATVEVAGVVEINSTTSEPAPAANETTSLASSSAEASSTSEAALAPSTTIAAADEATTEPEVAAPTTATPTTVTETTASSTTATPTTVASTTTSATAAPTTTEEPPATTEEPPPTTEEPPPTTEEPPPNRAPFIRSVDATPLGVTVRGGSCTGERTQIVVEAVDDGEIQSVIASWSPAAGSAPLSQELNGAGSIYAGPAGPWDETGPHVITVVVTDDRGETAIGQGNVRVTACPIGDFTT